MVEELIADLGERIAVLEATITDLSRQLESIPDCDCECYCGEVVRATEDFAQRYADDNGLALSDVFYFYRRSR